MLLPILADFASRSRYGSLLFDGDSTSNRSKLLMCSLCGWDAASHPLQKILSSNIGALINNSKRVLKPIILYLQLGTPKIV